jgi:hypothetical protein
LAYLPLYEDSTSDRQQTKWKFNAVETFNISINQLKFDSRMRRK